MMSPKMYERALEACRRQYHAEESRKARECFEKHELLAEHYWGTDPRGQLGATDPGQYGAWIIGEPGSSNLRLHISALTMGQLVLVGDLDTVGWAYGPKPPKNRLRWMARSVGGINGYFMEKLVIATGRQRDEWCEFNAELAWIQALYYRRLGYISRGVMEEVQIFLHGYRIDDCINPYTDLLELLFQEDNDSCEWAPGIGMRIKPAVFMYSAALQKCDELVNGPLQEEGKW